MNAISRRHFIKTASMGGMMTLGVNFFTEAKEPFTSQAEISSVNTLISDSAKSDIPLTVDLTPSANSDHYTVLRDILNLYKTRIPEGPALGIKPLKVSHHFKGYPQCITNTLPERYEILLAAGGGPNGDDYAIRDYCRVVFQFAHELCHLYTDPRSSNWFTETLCEMSSLYCLTFMAEKWNSAPPAPYLKNYADFFLSYKNSHIIQAKKNLELAEKEKKRVRNWRSLGNIDSLTRNEHTILAEKLLPLFTDNLLAWHTMPYLGLAQDTINLKNHVHNQFKENTRFDFTLWRKAVPPELRPLVDTMCRICE